MDARVSRGLFALGLCGSALALGAIHTPVLIAVAAVFAVSLALGADERAPLTLRPPALLLLLLSVVLIAFTALQSVPLPAAAVAMLSSHNADVWLRALRPVQGAVPSWFPCSLDPIATHAEVLRGTIYLTAFVVALRLAARREGAVFLERTLLASSVVIAFAAVAHPAVGAERVFGLYKPANDFLPRHIAPLLNANHLAGYLNIGICVGAVSPFLPNLTSLDTS